MNHPSHLHLAPTHSHTRSPRYTSCPYPPTLQLSLRFSPACLSTATMLGKRVPLRCKATPPCTRVRVGHMTMNMYRRTHSTGACADLVWGVLYDIARASLPPLALPETHSASRALGLLPPSRIIALPFQVHLLRPISPKIKGLHAVACNHLSDLGRGRCLSSGIADEHI